MQTGSLTWTGPCVGWSDTPKRGGCTERGDGGDNSTEEREKTLEACMVGGQTGRLLSKYWLEEQVKWAAGDWKRETVGVREREEGGGGGGRAY